MKKCKKGMQNIAQNQSLGLKILREDIRHYKA